MSDFKLDIDIRQALIELANLKTGLEGIRAEMARVTSAGKNVFSRTQTEAEKIADEINSLRSEYKKLEDAQSTLKRALSAAFDPEAAKKYAAALADVESAMEEVRAVAQPLGVELGAELGDAIGKPATQQTASALDALQREYNDLAAAAARVRLATDSALDPQEVERYTSELREAENALADMERRGRSVGVDLPRGFQDFNKQASLGKEIAGEFFGQFTRVALVVEGARALGAFASEAVRTAENYKKTEIAFQSLLQGSGDAEAVIDDVNRFAAANAIADESAQQAAKSFLAFGTPLEELGDDLRQTADISAGTGKNFNELATIYGKARVAGVLYAEDINQLVDAGVPIIEEFANVLGRPQAEIKKLASEGEISFGTLQKAFQNLTGEGGKFAGLAQKQAEVVGAATRAASEWSKVLRTVGDFLAPIKNAALDVFGTLLGGINRVMNPSKALSGEYATQLERVQKLDASLPGLLSRYDVLAGKANLTKSEQAELNSLLNKLGDIVPGAVTQVDNYGNVLGLNTGKIREFSAEQRNLLGDLAKLKLDQANAELKELQGSYESLKKLAAGQDLKIEVGGTATFTGTTLVRETTIKATAEQQAEARKKLIELQTKELELTRQRADAERTIKEVQEGAVKTREDVVKTVSTTTTSKTTSDTKVSAKKAAEERFRLELEQDRLRADLLKDGVAREKALEEIRYKEQLRSLRETFNGKSELRELEAKAEAQHIETLSKIELDAEAEALAKEVDILRAKQEARQQSLNSELEALERNAAEVGGIEQRRIEARIEYEKRVRELSESGASLDAQTVAYREYTEKLEEIETKAIEERTQKRVSLFQEQQKTEALEFEAGQETYIAQYAATRGVTEEQVQNVERNMTELRKAFALKQQQELIEFQLSLGEGISEAQRKQLEAQLETVSAQLERAKGAGEGGGFNLFEFLGANTEREKQAIISAAGEIVGAIEQIAAAQYAAAQAAREAADERVSAAQEELDRQLELAELGFASDVTRAQQKLETEKTNQQSAVEAQKRAARQQLAIDTAQQVSSIVTASARIFAESAKFFPVGLILAAASIASLFATMASVRSRARAISAGQFRQGGEGRVDENGIVRGPSHEGGGIKVAEVEGDEFFTSDGRTFAVVNRKMTAKHFALLKAINRDDRNGMRAALVQLAGLPTMKSDVAPSPSESAQIHPRGAEGFTAQERKQLIGLVKQINSKKPPTETTIIKGNGTTTIVSGNTTRTIRTSAA